MNVVFSNVIRPTDFFPIGASENKYQNEAKIYSVGRGHCMTFFVLKLFLDSPAGCELINMS